MSKGSKAGLIRYVKFLVEAGAMKRPLWLDALERVPPPPLPKAGRRPPTLRFPEDDFVLAYYRTHPGAALEPVDLGSFNPNTARRVAMRRLQYIKQGLSSSQAREAAEREVAMATGSAAGSSVGGGAAISVLSRVQAEEESHLREAIRTYTERHGHSPGTRERAPKAYHRAKMAPKTPPPPVVTMSDSG